MRAVVLRAAGGPEQLSPPAVDSVFPLEDAVRALERSMATGKRGKVVLRGLVVGGRRAVPIVALGGARRHMTAAR
jgi:hypothetical protein